MKNIKKQSFISSVINALLNVTNDEWPRIFVSWLMQFFYKAGYIMGWTVLIAMFVTKYGIAALPYFFILYSLFRILSAFIYANFINHFRKDLVILFTALAGCLTLFVGLLFSSFNSGVFIIIAIGVLAVFFSQIYILNTAFIEDLFSPLESERTFPIIESAETIGGIMGGLIIALFASSMQPVILVYLMMASLLFIIPIMISHRQILKKLPFIHFRKKKVFSKINISVIKDSLSHMKQFPFLKVLMIVMFCQWIFNNLLEFQYTSAVYNGVSEGAQAEHELAKGLGTLQIIFHSFALLMQLFVAGRIMSYLGVISSMLLHPLVALLSLGTLLFRFGFASAVVTKMNFEMTNIIYVNSYHSSYYAMGHKIREQIRELLEGFIQPLGALAGMLVLLILEQIFHDNTLTTTITLLMIGIMVLMLMVILKNENKYTHIAVKNLTHSNNVILQLNAVEVLGQKGHRGATEILTKTLKNPLINDKVKIKIISTLGHIKDQDSTLEILDCLKSQNSQVKVAALKSINKFEHIAKDFVKFPFSHYRINEVLKDIFSKEDDREIKSLIITIIAKMNKNDIVPFILELLKTNDSRLTADCISVCSYFNDINLVHYLIPFLESEDPKIQANTIYALWQFKNYRVKLLPVLDELLHSTDLRKKIAGYRVAGDIKAIQERNRLKDSLKSPYAIERLEAAGALSKMNYNDGIKIMVDSILLENEKLKSRALILLDSIPDRISSQIKNLLLRRVSAYINLILAESSKTSLDELDTETLIKLRKAYDLVNDHEEVQNIDEIITKNNQILKTLQFNPS